MTTSTHHVIPPQDAPAADAGTVEPLVLDWPAALRVHAVCSTRPGGVSSGPWAGLNLGRSGGDDTDAVTENRRRFAAAVGLPSEPCWLHQVHGARVVRWTHAADDSLPQADAAYTTVPGVVCDVAGTVVAAAHAGWRGLAGGVLQNTVAAMTGTTGVERSQLRAWLGPAIGPQAFEVGAEVREAFVAQASEAEAAFQRTTREDKYLADLFMLARQALAAAGVRAVSGGGLCTYSDPRRYFSFRRDRITGRMAAMIWLAP